MIFLHGGPEVASTLMTSIYHQISDKITACEGAGVEENL